ncbi:hypothetical protein GON01_08200 [Sphingomonas sp. MAH-20]|uniref:Uncharacterized protein n=1 Tax=Sphingomonas horti TaxID=2682842 RepID=A0A6I4J1E3_9SPHN|nr:hypothetical protein [Sphingomonas horti]
MMWITLCGRFCVDKAVNSGGQLDKFKEAARQLETDDDPERFKDRLKKLVKHKPVEKPE